MGTITIKNLSTLMDKEAVRRVMWYMMDNMYPALYDMMGNVQIVSITKCGNTYTVTDAEGV